MKLSTIVLSNRVLPKQDNYGVPLDSGGETVGPLGSMDSINLQFKIIVLRIKIDYK